MPLGNAGGYSNSSSRGFNNNRRNGYEPSVNSRLRIHENDSKRSLHFSFFSGMLKISIVDLVPRDNGEGQTYKSANDIFLTCTKAILMIDCVKQFEQYIAEGNTDSSVGFGINTGLGEIATVMIVHLNSEGKKALMINKVKPNGEYESSAEFVFPTEYNFNMKYSNIEENKFDTNYVEDIEWIEFKNILKNFVNSYDGSYGYSSCDMSKPRFEEINRSLSSICSNLGIERVDYSSRQTSNNNFYSNLGNRGNQGSSEHKSVDDIMDSLPGDD